MNPLLNARAKTLYERLGYRDSGRSVYLDGIYDGDADWVIDLMKRLEPGTAPDTRECVASPRFTM